jgi:hypothetical protein
MKKIQIQIVIFLNLVAACSYAQSFDDEKVAAINFITRMYNASPIEGTKQLEADDKHYSIVAIALPKTNQDSEATCYSKALSKAQVAAEQGFAEPTIKFEMLFMQGGKENNNITYVFLCETLSDFVVKTIKKKAFDGARIISAPANKYLVAVVTLDNSKYTSATMRDKAASMKAKQMTNTLVNGSVITSDIVIKTEESEKAATVSSTEIVKENAMGTINGLELLKAQEINPNQTTYIYYSHKE